MSETQARIDFDKPIQVSCENKWIDAEVVHRLPSGAAVLVWETSKGEWVGKALPQDIDLVRNKPETSELWVNVYRNGDGLYAASWSSRDEADANALGCRLACVKVYEEVIEE